MIDLGKLEELRAKATPGPWRPSQIGLENSGARVVTSDGGRIGTADTWSQFKRGDGWRSICETRDANAALIALAPELADEVLRLTAERDAAVAASQKLAAENARLAERDTEALRLLTEATDWNWLDYWELCETDSGMDEAKMTLPSLWHLDDDIAAFLAGGVGE